MNSHARRPVKILLAFAFAALLAGCAATSKNIPENAAMLKKIGLPVYPGATPFGTGVESTVNTPMGAMVTTMARFETADAFETVKAFYMQRAPATRREVSLPLGKGIQNTMLQYIDGSTQKQIQVVEVKGVTMIGLSSTDLRLQRASPSPAATGSP